MRGSVNYFHFARAVGMRCEPGVGGRLIEVYDEQTGEGRELARITAWEPGRRLARHSSVDDMEIEVRFAPSAAGTDVTVTATIPAGEPTVAGPSGCAWCPSGSRPGVPGGIPRPGHSGSWPGWR